MAFDSSPGDSGGVIFAPNAYPDPPNTNRTLYGFHVHSDPDNQSTDRDGWFTAQDTAQSRLSVVTGVIVNWCVSPGCGF